MHELFRNILGITHVLMFAYSLLPAYTTFLPCICYLAFLLFCCVIIVLHFIFKCFVCVSLSSIHIHAILFYSIQNIPDRTSREFLSASVN